MAAVSLWQRNQNQLLNGAGIMFQFSTTVAT